MDVVKLGRESIQEYQSWTWYHVWDACDLELIAVTVRQELLERGLTMPMGGHYDGRSKLRELDPLAPDDSYAWQRTQDAEACDKLLELLREHHGDARLRADKVEEIGHE